MDTMIGKSFGGCVLESKIGQGGMGTVYKAHHSTLNITVAIKLLHSLENVAGSEDRFLREAQIMARFRHPNIVAVMNAGVENGAYFIVMEFIEGCNLQQMITNKSRLPVEIALNIATDILHALEAALEQGIVHRDIKPENILIDNSGISKLADLGLARFVSGSEHLTQTNIMLGSPHYIAPEQADNPSSVDCRTDIYSLGCTLFHMLSGSTPFAGNSMIEIIMNHVKNPVPHLRDAEKNIPEYIDEIIFTMMQKDVSKRFATPSEVLRALEYRKSAIVPSAGVTGRTENRRFPKSAPTLTIGATAVIVLLILILGSIEFIKREKRSITFKAVETLDTLSQAMDTTDSTKNDSVPHAKKPAIPKKNVIKVTPALSAPPVHSQPVPKENPLIAVVKIGDTQGVKALLAKGVSPKCDPTSPTTPLHEAVRRGLTVETQLLLSSGADPEARDKTGNTALHYAVKENASLMVKLLLEHGANPNTKDLSGKTPLKMAGTIDTELERLLEQYGAK